MAQLSDHSKAVLRMLGQQFNDEKTANVRELTFDDCIPIIQETFTTFNSVGHHWLRDFIPIKDFIHRIGINNVKVVCSHPEVFSMELAKVLRGFGIPVQVGVTEYHFASSSDDIWSQKNTEDMKWGIVIYPPPKQVRY